MHAADSARRPRAPCFIDPPGYVRHRPETTQLYRLVEQYYSAFREVRAVAETAALLADEVLTRASAAPVGATTPEAFAAGRPGTAAAIRGV